MPLPPGAWLSWPVDGVVAEVFELPEERYGAGHRGIDISATRGTAVRAAAAGRVTFSGPVGGGLAVTIAHEAGLETTYSILDEVHVGAGEPVAAGTWIGRVGAAHPGGEGDLHFGVKSEGSYVDPRLYLAPVDAARAIYLVPVRWRAPEALRDTLDRALWVTGIPVGCGPASGDLPSEPAAPNPNVAVAVAGLGSATAGGGSAEMYDHGPEALGYPSELVYRFSYRGTDGPRFHELYEPSDTWGDIRAAALELGRLLRAVRARHPERAIDLIAHSQGGIVARSYLALVASGWDPGAPRVEHLVTFSSPHGGAPLAGTVEPLRKRTLTGDTLIESLGRWAERGGPIPDPRSVAVAQLAPGSGLLRQLDRQDLVFGVRALSLGIANDVVVPADRARMPEELGYTVGPEGLNGHASIVSSGAARRLAHAFLRDAPDPCRSGWDPLGPALGRALGAAETRLPSLVRAAERAALRRLIALLL